MTAANPTATLPPDIATFVEDLSQHFTGMPITADLTLSVQMHDEHNGSVFVADTADPIEVLSFTLYGTLSRIPPDGLQHISLAALHAFQLTRPLPYDDFCSVRTQSNRDCAAANSDHSDSIFLRTEPRQPVWQPLDSQGIEATSVKILQRTDALMVAHGKRRVRARHAAQEVSAVDPAVMAQYTPSLTTDAYVAVFVTDHDRPVLWFSLPDLDSIDPQHGRLIASLALAVTVPELADPVFAAACVEDLGASGLWISFTSPFPDPPAYLPDNLS